MLKRALIISILQITFFIAVTSPDAGEVIKYHDKLGRTVEIGIPVRRAVFLQLYEMLPTLDAWDHVVGVADYARRNEVIRAAKPDIDDIPSAGNGWNVNVEAVLKLKPDLVITWAAAPKSINFMEEKGLKTLAVYPESIGELYETMNLLGRLFEREDRMASAENSMDRIFSLIRRRVAQIPESERIRMIYVSGQPNNVACALGINNDLLRVSGGINPAGNINERSTLVSLEQIVMWNPEKIFIWGSAGYTAEDLIDNMQWRHIKAIKNHAVFKLPDWTTWGPRLPLVALCMAIRSYPERFSDVDFISEADRLYREAFNIPCNLREIP